MGLEAARAIDGDALVAACVRGERDAERVLFRQEYPRVNATVFRLIGGSRDADDLVQETFIAVFRALPKFRGEAKLSTWIDRIAVRVVFAHIRQRHKLPVPSELLDEVEEPAARPDERAHAREGLRRLYAVLARLKPEARLAFALYAIDGRTIAEVAELTDTTLVTAKLRIWRARREVERRAENDPILRQFVGVA